MSMNVLTAWPRPASSIARRIAGRVFLAGALVSLAAAGLGLAVYLAVENLQGQSGVCVGLAHGCAAVQLSQYGKIFGVPVSVPGAALYGVLALLAVAWGADWRGWRPTWAALGGLGAAAGFAFSMYLTGIEAFVLEKWCIYCVASASLMTALAALWMAPLVLAIREVRRPGGDQSPLRA
jgi:uncharacterized membrane protein